MFETCPDLEGIALSGWKDFTSDHLQYLVQQFKSLRRLDLSSINVSDKIYHNEITIARALSYNVLELFT